MPILPTYLRAGLSQYPHEREVLIGPLSCIEMRSTRVEGATIVAEMALSINLLVSS